MVYGIVNSVTMDGEPKPTKKPLSSASAIMNRHHKKRKKWYKTFLHGEGKKTDHRETIDREDLHKGVSRSLENVGQMNMSLLGFQGRASSASYLSRDDDSVSVSSSESDTADILGYPLQGRQLQRVQRYSSSDNEMTSESDVTDSYVNESDNYQKQMLRKVDNPNEKTNTTETGFSNVLSYLPLGLAPAATRGSSDSLLSQSEEKKTLVHLIEIAADSDPVSYLYVNLLGCD